MIDLSCFNQLSKQNVKSFNEEKSFIKKALNGQTIHCRSCQKVLNRHFINNNTQIQLLCSNGCTDILLDIETPKKKA